MICDVPKPVLLQARRSNGLVSAVRQVDQPWTWEGLRPEAKNCRQNNDSVLSALAGCHSYHSRNIRRRSPQPAGSRHCLLSTLRGIQPTQEEVSMIVGSHPRCCP